MSEHDAGKPETLKDDEIVSVKKSSRRKLLDVLHERSGQTLTGLCAHLDMTRQAVTKHLNLLESANLIAVVWHGREKRHYLNPVPIHEIYERWISKYQRPQLQALSDLKKHLETKKATTPGKAKVRLRHPHRL